MLWKQLETPGIHGAAYLQVVDANNHVIDALRYSLEPVVKKKTARRGML